MARINLKQNQTNQMLARLSDTQKKYLGYSLFWLLVFLLNIGPQWDKYANLKELIETAGTLTLLQMLIAVIAIKVLIPRFLNSGRHLLFILCLFLTTYIACEINILIRVLYLEPTYAESYKRFTELYGHMVLSERMFSLWTMRWLIFSKAPQLLYPAAILIGHVFYKNQQKLLRINELKRKAELEALKNQLNPHFIFNTLNNLYALTLKKSDKAPIVIEKLSDILDYVIYRCNDDLVPLDSEVKLLNSYITLEQIRYGKRISVNFETKIDGSFQIAPLILLTLVENACKHSSGEEINQAVVDVQLSANENVIYCKVVNSKPIKDSQASEQGIGLANMKRQLDLIYAENYQLKILDNKNSYQTELTINL